MTFQLRRLWMIELGSDDGIWGHDRFLVVLTWNLMCQVNNTNRIWCLLYHVEWADKQNWSTMHLFCQLKIKSAGCPVEISKPRLFQSNRLGTNLTNFFKWNVFMSNSIQLLKAIADCCFQTVTGQFLEIYQFIISGFEEPWEFASWTWDLPGGFRNTLNTKGVCCLCELISWWNIFRCN